MRRLTAATFAVLVALSAIASSQGRSTSRPGPRTPEQSGGRRPGLSNRRNHHRSGACRDASRTPDLPCARPAVPPRIEAYDKNGPAINAIVVINPNALAEADDLDRRFKATGPVGPLHCIPAIVKDNFETIGLQSADGSLSLAGIRLEQGRVSQVKRIKDAGAIVLAKSNMAEFAFSPYETVNSILPGYTRNPYALDRVTAGSSGGTAAAIAANFGSIGLGSDTGNSIRGPSSHQALVGIRSTMGLTSRAGSSRSACSPTSPDR